MLICLIATIKGTYLFHQVYTPLDVACQEGHLHIVRLLLRRGAKIETRDKVGQSQSRLYTL